jgi:hypothetical protein
MAAGAGQGITSNGSIIYGLSHITQRFHITLPWTSSRPVSSCGYEDGRAGFSEDRGLKWKWLQKTDKNLIFD